jgi:hypothetical protein
MGEMGTLGVVTFAVILFLLWRNLRWAKKQYKSHPEWGKDYLFHLIQAISLSVLLMLFLGNSLHNLLRFNWLWYGAFLVVAVHRLQQRLQEEQAVAPQAAPATLAPAWAAQTC